MKLSDKTFQVLDTLDRQEISTQRQLAEHAGISLGQVNYILKSLLEKGLVKIGKFRKNPQKISYLYLLTPKGIELRSKLAVKFVLSKLREYNTLQNRLIEKLTTIEEEGHVQVIFVGPPIVKDFVVSIIRQRHMKLALVGHCTNWKDLRNIKPEAFDRAILFDDNSEGITKIGEATGISREKLLPFW